MLSAENIIIQYVATLLVLLERVKGLNGKEREIFKRLLEDAKFFEPTTKEVFRNLALEQWPVDKELKQYFKSI